jgi:hypothetical protein
MGFTELTEEEILIVEEALGDSKGSRIVILWSFLAVLPCSFLSGVREHSKEG